tara:strand:- start:1532 stop:1822 length:291 start_codon:yes stop_codon:yes gene_type:complete
MDELDQNSLLPLLNTLGLDPNDLSKEKMNVLLQTVNKAIKSNDFSTENLNSILQSMGINNNNIDNKKTEPKKRDKIGRNELCSCGSKKKYKKCCGK